MTIQLNSEHSPFYLNNLTLHFRALLFTAPEILATGVTHPDHVGCGTIQGDVYSMAMITYEIITKEPAFNEFMDFMEIDEILDCIAGRRPTPQQVIHIVLKSLAYSFIGLATQG